MPDDILLLTDTRVLGFSVGQEHGRFFAEITFGGRPFRRTGCASLSAAYHWALATFAGALVGISPG